jgi:plastocyanin
MNTKTTFMFTRRFSVAFAMILSALGCSADDVSDASGRSLPRDRPPEAIAGDQGSSAAEAGSFSDAEVGGTHPGGQGGAASEPPTGQGGDGRLVAGGAGAQAAGGAGDEAAAGSEGGTPGPFYVNGCFAFVDRTVEAASRTIVWDDALIFNPARCMRVRVGHTVTFAGDHGNHPLIPQGGDTPNPVGPTATFTMPGIFGYECVPHPSEMNGAIEVVP